MLARKAVRVIFYKENDRINAIKEQVGGKGYAVGFEGLVDYISANLPVNEEIGKALRKEIPMYPLPAPDFQRDELFTKVVMFAPMTLRQMNKEDKRRACYQHCCLEYLSGKKMTNESFRGRLNISDENYSIASRIISDTIAAQYIKLDDAMASSKKYARYIPFWV